MYLISLPDMAGGCLVLPRWAFALWWLLLLAMHIVVATYNAAYALFYLELNGTYLNTVLEFFSLGMPAPYHHRIAVAYSIMAALHALCLLMMIVGSIWHRKLRFFVDIPRLKRWKARTVRNLRAQQPESRLAAGWSSIYANVLGRDGILGVDSPHFHQVLIFHEIVETLLQSIQAYRMSAVLPRIRENRFYVTLLVLNCCAPLLIHRVYKHNEPRKRFANLMCDCILDLVVSVGIPALIVLTYVGQYDSYYQGFPTENWYNDIWVAHVLNEFQLVLVVSWKDLFSRIVFSWGILSTSTSMKELLAYASPTKVAAIKSPTVKDIKEADKSDPAVRDASKVASKVERIDNLVETNVPNRLKVKYVYYAFLAWGVVVLGFHIHAESRPQLAQCLLQVRPWGIARPSCYLVELNCHRLEIVGSKRDVIEQWSAFDQDTVVQLLVRHCPAFEMPPIVQQFNKLNGFKVYNSTIAQWGKDAAFTGTHHKHIVTVYMVRVTLKNGVIPEGLLSRDFPPTLIDFEIVVSNLREIPDDIDEIWPLGSSVYIEYGEMTSVPASLIRLQPYYMSVCGNPIESLPVELFEIQNLLFLHAGGTLISELPQNVTALSPALLMFYVYETEISTFWSWIDPYVTAGHYVVAGGSPYCKSLEHYIESGNDILFYQNSLQSSNYSILMFPANYLDIATTRVLCIDDYTYATSLYPLASEDRNSAISPI